MLVRDPRVLIIGASARAAAESAERAGLKPSAIDLFCDSDLQARVPSLRVHQYPEEMFAAAGRFAPMPWLYTGGLENYARLVDQISARHDLLGNAGAVLRCCRDPGYLAELVSGSGVYFPETAASTMDGDWICKPYQSAGGLRVQRGCASLPSNCYGQHLIEGRTLGATFLANAVEAKLLGITEQLSGWDWGAPGEFQYAGSCGPIQLDQKLHRQCCELGDLLVARLKLKGLFGVDLIQDHSARLWLLEINPRYTASVELLERASGESLMTAHVEACRTGNLMHPNRIRSQRVCAKLILFATGPTALTRSHMESAQRHLSAMGVTCRDVPHAPVKVESGAPILTIEVEGMETEGTREWLRKAHHTAHQFLGNNL